MAQLPESIKAALETCAGPMVFTTVSPDGNPNSVYVAWCWAEGADSLVVCDNYFSKTRANILGGGLASILFQAAGGKAFQVKGRLKYLTSGPAFERMRAIVDAKHPRVAAVALTVEEAYSGSERLA